MRVRVSDLLKTLSVFFWLPKYSERGTNPIVIGTVGSYIDRVAAQRCFCLLVEPFRPLSYNDAYTQQPHTQVDPRWVALCMG